MRRVCVELHKTCRKVEEKKKKKIEKNILAAFIFSFGFFERKHHGDHYRVAPDFKITKWALPVMDFFPYRVKDQSECFNNNRVGFLRGEKKC